MVQEQRPVNASQLCLPRRSGARLGPQRPPRVSFVKRTHSHYAYPVAGRRLFYYSACWRHLCRTSTCLNALDARSALPCVLIQLDARLLPNHVHKLACGLRCAKVVNAAAVCYRRTGPGAHNFSRFPEDEELGSVTWHRGIVTATTGSKPKRPALGAMTFNLSDGEQIDDASQAAGKRCRLFMAAACVSELGGTAPGVQSSHPRAATLICSQARTRRCLRCRCRQTLYHMALQCLKTGFK